MNDLILSRYGIEPGIIIPETHFFTLIVENKALLLSVLSELRSQSQRGNDGSFSLLLSGKTINIEKSMSLISDFTDIDFNSKPIINLLTKKFSEFLSLGEQVQPLMELERVVINLTENFRIKSGLNIEYDTTINGGNLAKVCSLKISDDKRSLLQRLCEYVNLICDLKPLKLFVLPFAKSFLEKSDIEKLYRHCFDKAVRLLIIEGADSTDILSNERRLIIDKDLCTIPINYGDSCT